MAWRAGKPESSTSALAASKQQPQTGLWRSCLQGLCTELRSLQKICKSCRDRHFSHSADNNFDESYETISGHISSLQATYTQYPNVTVGIKCTEQIRATTAYIKEQFISLETNRFGWNQRGEIETIVLDIQHCARGKVDAIQSMVLEHLSAQTESSGFGSHQAAASRNEPFRSSCSEGTNADIDKVTGADRNEPRGPQEKGFKQATTGSTTFITRAHLGKKEGSVQGQSMEARSKGTPLRSTQDAALILTQPGKMQEVCICTIQPNEGASSSKPLVSAKPQRRDSELDAASEDINRPSPPPRQKASQSEASTLEDCEQTRASESSEDIEPIQRCDHYGEGDYHGDKSLSGSWYQGPWHIETGPNETSQLKVPVIKSPGENPSETGHLAEAPSHDGTKPSIVQMELLRDQLNKAKTDVKASSSEEYDTEAIKAMAKIRDQSSKAEAGLSSEKEKNAKELAFLLDERTKGATAFAKEEGKHEKELAMLREEQTKAESAFTNQEEELKKELALLRYEKTTFETARAREEGKHEQELAMLRAEQTKAESACTQKEEKHGKEMELLRDEKTKAESAFKKQEEEHNKELELLRGAKTTAETALAKEEGKHEKELTMLRQEQTKADSAFAKQEEKHDKEMALLREEKTKAESAFTKQEEKHDNQMAFLRDEKTRAESAQEEKHHEELDWLRAEKTKVESALAKLEGKLEVAGISNIKLLENHTTEVKKLQREKSEVESQLSELKGNMKARGDVFNQLIEKHKAQIATVYGEKSTAETNLAVNKVLLSEAQERLQQKTNECMSAQEANTKAEENINNYYEVKLKELGSKNQDLGYQLQQLQGEKSRLTNSVAEQTKLLQTKNDGLSDMKTKLQTASEELRRKNEEIRRKENDQARQALQWEEKDKASQSTIGQLRNQLHETQCSLQQNEKDLQEVSAKLRKEEAEIRQISTDHARQAVLWDEKDKSSQSKIKQLQSDLRNKEDDTRQMSTDHARQAAMWEGKVTSSQSKISQLTNEMHTIEGQLQQARGELRTIEEEKREAERKRREIIEVSCLLLNEPGMAANFKTARDDFMMRLGKQLAEQKKKLQIVEVSPSGDLPYDATNLQKPHVLIMPCLAVSRVSSSIDSLMSKPAAKAGHILLFVVFHPRAPHDRTVAPTAQQIGALPTSCEKLVDVVFNRSNGGIFDGGPNDAAVSEMAGYMRGRPAEQIVS